MDNLLQQGITAAKAGEKEKAFRLLTRAVQDRALAEHAWLWLSGVVGQDSERLFCLDNVLQINPNNEPAKRGAAILRQKGIFPSAPMPPMVQPNVPASSRPTPVTLQPSSRPVLSSGRSAPPKADPAPALSKPAVPAPEADKGQQDLSAIFKFAAVELANNRDPKAIMKELTARGLSQVEAGRIVAETQQVLKKARGDKYKKRMTRGMLWTIAGVIITCATLAFADQLGGQYVLCYGAIIFGVIDFLAGLFGWIFSR